MKKHVITRPKKQAISLANKIDNSLLEPLIEINYLNIDFPNSYLYDSFIVTSGYAKEILPEGCNCYSVGDYAPTASDLANKIISDNPDKQLKLLYLRGFDIAFDMKAALEAQGHVVDELISYKAVARLNFSHEFINALGNGDIGSISFFSKRTAEIFVGLAIKHDILDNIKGIKALCISNSMVECLYSIFGNDVEVSNSPDMR